VGGVLQPFALRGVRREVSVATAPHLAQVVAGQRVLGAELYRATATLAENWTMSPLSVDMAFGMLRAGCRGRSARELDRVFGFPLSRTPAGVPHAALNALSNALVDDALHHTAHSSPSSRRGGADPMLAIANGLFVDRAFAPRIDHAFLTLLALRHQSDRGRLRRPVRGRSHQCLGTTPNP
jgi:hypothetical protein